MYIMLSILKHTSPSLPNFTLKSDKLSFSQFRFPLLQLNKTITRLASLFTGNATEGPVDFMMLWQEIQLMMTNLEKMGNATLSSWAELFSIKDTLTGLVQSHSRAWEPVLDLLDENYIGSR